MLRQLRNNKGVTQIIVVLAMTGLLGAAALVIDIGAAVAERIKLSNAVDAATLAGAMELPTDPDEAVAKAREYIVLNDVDLSDVVITVGDDNRSLTIVAAENFKFYLAPAIGIKDTTLSASAKVIIAPASSAGGLRPFGIDAQDLDYGEQVTLKEGGGDGTTGNFGGVAFDDEFGAQVFNINIEYGYDGTLYIGDIIDTEPGNMSSSINTIESVIDLDPYATFNNFEPSSPRLWTIPVLDNMLVAGREEVTIVGFASFFIEDVVRNAGQTDVTGRFVQFTSNGDIDEGAPDLGFYGMKLTTP